MVPERLLAQDWTQLRDTRLRALRDSASSFMSTYARESEYKDGKWRAEFHRGLWWVLRDGSRVEGLIGASSPEDEDRWYLEYLWVAPEQRRRGMAAELVWAATDFLADKRVVHTAYLWVIDDNQVARGLYHQLGFTTDGTEQPLPNDPERQEVRMYATIPLIKGRTASTWTAEAVQSRHQLLS